MKRILSSWTFIGKNIIVLLLMAIVPSVGLTLVSSGTIAEFLIVFSKDIVGFEINGFREIYRYFTYMNINDFVGFLMWLVVVVVAMACIGLIYGFTERKMRLNVYSFKFTSLINDSILMILPYVAVCILIWEVGSALISLLILFLYTFLKGQIILYVLSVLMTFVSYAAIFGLFTYLSLTVPSMLIDGYSFRFASGYSISLAQKDFWHIYTTWLVPFIVSGVSLVAMEAVCSVMPVFAAYIVRFICTFIYYTYWMMYLPVMSVNNYMSATGLKRKDIGFGR